VSEQPSRLSDLAEQLAGPGTPTTDVRTATVDAVSGGRVQTSATGTAWLSRAMDVMLAVGDRVLVLQQGSTFVVVARLSGPPGSSWVKRKTVAQTATSTTTFQADNALFWTFDPGLYRVELFAHAACPDAGGAADIRSTWTNTGTMTGRGRSCIGPGSATTDNDASTTAAGSGIARITAHTLSATVVYGITDDATSLVHEDLMVEVTAAGTLTWNWAQGTSDSDAVTVSTSSRIYVTLLGAA
jgi:hypothetical protein